MQSRFKVEASNVLLGPLCGFLATILAIESFYVFLSVYLPFSVPGLEPISDRLFFISAILLGVQTYGMEAILKALPFALAYGAVAGVFIERLCEARRKNPAHA
jgi:hypothetical protein